MWVPVQRRGDRTKDQKDPKDREDVSSDQARAWPLDLFERTISGPARMPRGVAPQRRPTPMPRFISESIQPAPGTFPAQAMARGEPGLPARFTWRGDEYAVADVITAWTTSSPEGGSGEVYLRRHWWEVKTVDGVVMKIYCERQKKRRDAKSRWFLYSVDRRP